MSGVDPHERQRRLFSAQTAKATSRQRVAVARWQGTDHFYERVQEALGGVVDFDAIVVAQELTILAQPLPEDTELWRGIRSIDKTFGVNRANIESVVGRKWIENRFTSSTVSPEKAAPEFTHPGQSPAIMQIIARPGAPAVWIPPLGNPEFAGQSELLFMAGITVRILEIGVAGAIPLIRVEVT